jgi:succinyl-CoA synthetase beta subunit
MNLHEYQSKEILARFGVSVPRGYPAETVEEAELSAEKLGGTGWVVKSQIHAGGRGAGYFKGREGKEGGVRLCHSREAVKEAASSMLGNILVTKQTGLEGKRVRKVYVEELGSMDREFYLSMLVDRVTSRLVVIASKEGGMSIEEVAAENPAALFRCGVDCATGIMPNHARKLVFALGLEGDAAKDMYPFLKGLYEAFMGIDASLVEINPLVVTKENRLKAMDAKVSLDDNALSRHKDLLLLRDEEEENPKEREASDEELNYIKLDGSIGCMVNGAGLAMATMDTIKLYGGEPANFLDVGGGATKERVAKAFEIILSDEDVRGILVNIFGGIMRCDIIAEGILAAVSKLEIEVPLVVRLEGTNVDKGRKILRDSGLRIFSADDLGDASRKIVAEVEALS